MLSRRGDPVKHQADSVAKYFLSSVDDEAGDSLSNLKLQKLCYYAQGCHLAAEGSALFGETIEAWQHGPVVPDLYKIYKVYGSGPIPRDENFDPGIFSQKERDILDEVYSSYGQFTASRLRNMAHAERPWCEAYAKSPKSEISIGSMKEYFQTQLV